jgi:hypothetical protein
MTRLSLALAAALGIGLVLTTPAQAADFDTA